MKKSFRALLEDTPGALQLSIRAVWTKHLKDVLMRVVQTYTGGTK